MCVLLWNCIVMFYSVIHTCDFFWHYEINRSTESYRSNFLCPAVKRRVTASALPAVSQQEFCSTELCPESYRSVFYDPADKRAAQSLDPPAGATPWLIATWWPRRVAACRLNDSMFTNNIHRACVHVRLHRSVYEHRWNSSGRIETNNWQRPRNLFADRFR